jgi:hypothetical protein
MQLDQSRVQDAFHEFLQSPEGKKWIEEESGLVWLLAILSLVVAFIGLVLVCTVIFIVPGIKMMFGGLKFELVTSDLGVNLKKIGSRHRLMLGHGIIAGPTGASLILGSFESSQTEQLDALAERLANIYTEGSDDPDEAEVLKLLRSDKFHNNRRRRVPDALSNGRELWLFDISLKIEDTHYANDRIYIACLATEGRRGTILQLPWDKVGHVIDPKDELEGWLDASTFE